MKIIETIKEVRQARGYTQAEFARMCDISQPYYNRIERGRVSPGVELIEKMLEILELHVS